MQEISHFGPTFAKFREKRGYNLWQLCLKLGCHRRNFERIQKGVQEPRLTLALRMLYSIEVGFGDFFSHLAAQTELVCGDCISDFSSLQIPQTEDISCQKIFGLMLCSSIEWNHSAKHFRGPQLQHPQHIKD